MEAGKSCTSDAGKNNSNGSLNKYQEFFGISLLILWYKIHQNPNLIVQALHHPKPKKLKSLSPHPSRLQPITAKPSRRTREPCDYIFPNPMNAGPSYESICRGKKVQLIGSPCSSPITIHHILIIKTPTFSGATYSSGPARRNTEQGKLNPVVQPPANMTDLLDHRV